MRVTEYSDTLALRDIVIVNVVVSGDEQLHGQFPCTWFIIPQNIPNLGVRERGVCGVLLG